MSINTWYAVTVYDNDENRALPFSYDHPQPAGVVRGEYALGQLIAQVESLGCTAVKKAAMSAQHATELVGQTCRMFLSEDTLLTASEQGPLCTQPGYNPAYYAKHVRPSDATWVTEDFEVNPLKREDLVEPRTVAVFGARPADLWPSKDEKSVSMRYQRSEWWSAFDDIYSELEALADKSDLVVVTDETQGAAQLGYWASTALKREYYNVSSELYITFDGCERAWNNQLPVFSVGDFEKELATADKVNRIHEPPQDGGNLPRDVYKEVCQKKHAQMSEGCVDGVCLTIYGTAAVPALPGVPLDFNAIMAGLTAAGRQGVYSMDELAQARAGVDGRIEQAQGKVNAISSQMDAARARLDAFVEIAAQRPGGEYLNYIEDAQEKVDELTVALAAAQEELSAAKGARSDFSKIDKAALCCDMGAAMESLGVKARKRPTVAAYGEKARIYREVPTVKLQPRQADATRQHQV